MISDLDNSIVFIGSTNNESIGTGFVIGKSEGKAYVVTCAHVINYAGGENNIIVGSTPAQVIAQGNDKDFDLAVLEVDGLLDKSILILDYHDEESEVFITSGFYNFYSENEAQEASIRRKQIIGRISQKNSIYSRKLNESYYELELNLEGHKNNRLREGYSGSPVFDVMRNVVVGVVNTCEDSGAIGTAISVETLRIVWKGMPHELLPTKNKLNEASNTFTSKTKFVINYSFVLFVVVILMFLSSASVYLSYNCFDSVVVNDYPWQKQFGKDGYAIEIGRTLIFFIAELILLLIVFPEECKEFFFFKSTSKENKKLVKSIQYALIAFSISALTYIIYYHFNKAPKELFELTNRCIGSSKSIFSLDSDEGYILYKLPYKYYFLYSFINYVFVVCPVVAICLYATVKDFMSLSKSRDAIDFKLKKIKSINQQLKDISAKSREAFGMKVCRLLTKFKLDFTYVINRYSSLFFILLFGIAYEIAFGSRTLAQEAVTWSMVAFALFTLTSCSVFVGYLYYEKVFNNSIGFLESVGYKNVELYRKNSYIYMFFEYLNSNILFVLGIIILLIIAVLISLQGDSNSSILC